MKSALSYPVPNRRMGLNIEQLREAAVIASSARLSLDQLAEPSATSCDVVALSDDLLLARSRYNSVPEDVHSTAWEFDYQDWLFLHFRLDGVSRERDRRGQEYMVGSHSFLLSSSGSEGVFMRQVLGENWRTVGIACRPSFVRTELGLREDALPKVLRQCSCDEEDAGGWYAGAMDAEMLQVARNLLEPPVVGGTRDIYLRAKTVELLCLALESLDKSQLQCTPAVKLNARDVQCLYVAKQLIEHAQSLPSLEQLARHVGLNRNKLSAGFKHVFGEPVVAYYRGLRLDRARTRIVSGESTIGRIAEEAGYSDPGSFSKAFRQRFGVLPSEVQ